MQKWLPVIDPENCTGCVACVDVCEPQSLQMVDGIAVLTQPDTCVSDEHCIEACATDAIRMEWIESTGDAALGRWQGDGGGRAAAR
jgi:NAD-dependent dihydropyrimidine dehydrogenase PreA subunit